MFTGPLLGHFDSSQGAMQPVSGHRWVAPGITTRATTSEGELNGKPRHRAGVERGRAAAGSSGSQRNGGA